MKTHGFIKDSDGLYTLSLTVSQYDILTATQEILGRRFRRGASITSPAQSKDYLISQIAHLEHEVFFMLFLDNRQHRKYILEAQLTAPVCIPENASNGHSP